MIGPAAGNISSSILNELMRLGELGPNGAMIRVAELIVGNLDKITEEIRSPDS